MKHKPTADEKAIIIKCAQYSAGMKGVTLEVGERWNTERPRGDEGRNRSINIATLTTDPDWNDTDLFETLKWKWFCRGFELTEDRRAVVDFYVYNKARYDVDVELQTNVVAYWFDGKLAKVTGVGDGAIWKDGAFQKRSPILA